MIYRESIAALIRNLKILSGIFGRIFARMSAIYCHYQRRGSENQRSPGIAFGWITRITRDKHTRIRDPPRIYVTYCFRGCTTTKGSLHDALILHFSSSSPSSPSAFAFTLPGLRIRSFTSRRYCVTMYTTGADSYGAPCHGFGHKRYYFSQFAKQMLPIVKPSPPPPSVSLLRGVYFAPTHLRQSSTLRYFAFVRSVE